MSIALEPIEIVAELVRKAKRMLFITGAGISADSGLPTYRGVGGLYESQCTDEGLPIEEALSGRMFVKRPEITWKYLWQIGSVCHGAKPNAAHKVIASLQKQKPESWVLTQNVDGLHRAAGSENLIEVHGNASQLFCCDCRKEYTADGLFGNYSGEPHLPPRCQTCNGVIRPDVVLFGETLPHRAVSFLSTIPDRHFNLVISIGTSGVFQYILEPVLVVRMQGMPTVEINPSTTTVSGIVDHRIRLGAAEAMAKIWECMKL
jgi:NAD-dependent deacetylase